MLNIWAYFFTILFFTLAKSPIALAEQGCVFIKSNVQAQEAETGSKLPFTAGRILPFTEFDSDKKRFKILYRGKDYWIPAGITKMGSANLCSFEPKCFTSERASNIYSEFKSSSNKMGIAIKGQKFPMAGKVKVGKEQWVQLDVGDKFGWMPLKFGSVEDRACPNTDLAQKARFVFIVELGAENGIAATNYKSALSTVTDPSDVEYTLPDPFFTKVSPGSGAYLNFLLGVDIRDTYRVEAGVGYGVFNFSMTTYDNPSNHPDLGGIPFSSLTPRETAIPENYILFPVAAYYKFGQSRWTSKLGLRVDFLYSIGKNFEYFYYTGTLTKRLQSQTFSLGPDVISHKESLDFRVQYKLGTSTELGLSLKYSSFNSTSASLFFEF